MNPAYQNPDRRGRAGVTRGDRDDQDGEKVIKHTDIHLRIRTLIAEAGRETRAATQTIKMKKGPVPKIRDLLYSEGWVSPTGNSNMWVATSNNHLTRGIVQ